MNTWEIASVCSVDTATMRRYLQEDWEPFAVTLNSEGIGIIWFKKHYITK